jgi:uncharacterized HAD superfamily protein
MANVKRWVLGLDLDDTIVSFMDHFLSYLRDRHGLKTPSSAREVTGYDMCGWLEMTPFQVQQLLDDFQRDVGMRLPLVDGAKPALTHLAQRWDMVAITARPSYISGITNALINYHLGDCIGQVIHVGLEPGRSIAKWQVAHTLGIQVMVEDSLSQALEAAAHGIRIVLMDRGYGWNQSIRLPAGVVRVHSWGQAVRVLSRWERRPWQTNRLSVTTSG